MERKTDIKIKRLHKLRLILLLGMFIVNMTGFSQEFEMPGFIYDLTSCDFDSDGAYDILVSCPYCDTIAILYNDGIGNFDTYYYNHNTGFILCGLIDSDNLEDIITRDGYYLYCIKNLGNRMLSENIAISQISGTYSVSHIIDVNNDSLNDLLYTHTSDEYWGIFKNNGNLTFTNEIIQSGSSTTTPAVGFITDDSLPDIVLTYSAFDRSSVNVNNGNFNFTEVVLEQTFLGEAFVMDLDNQGTEDFAFSISYSKSIALYKFIGNDQFELQSNFYAEGTYPISSFLPADFNQDGYDDFAITRGDWWNSSDSLYIYINDHNWSFNFQQSIYIGQLGYFKACSSDLNGDSYPDIFMKGCNGNNILTLLWNDGYGNFGFKNPVGIVDNQLNRTHFNVSPNPFSSQTRIKLSADKSKDIQIIITNLLGQIIQRVNLKDFNKNNDDLIYRWDGCDSSGNVCPPGIYFISLNSKTGIRTEKVVRL